MRPSRKKIVWRFLVIAIAALLLVWFIPTWLANRSYDADVERAKAEHIPLTYAEIPTGPPVSPADNAASDYMAASKLFVDSNNSFAKFNTGPFWKKIEIDFAANKPAVDRFFAGAFKPYLDLPNGVGANDQELRQEFLNLSGVERILSGEAIRRCWFGDPIGALDLLRPLPSAARNVTKSRYDLATIEGWSIESRAISGVAEVLHYRGLEPGVAEAAAEVLKDPLPPPDLEVEVEISAIPELELLKDADNFRAKLRAAIKARQKVLGAVSSVAGPPSPKSDPMDLPIKLSYIPWAVSRWRTQRLRLLIDTVETIRKDKWNRTQAMADYKRLDDDEAKGKYGPLLQIGGGGLADFLAFSAYDENKRRVVVQGAEILRLWRITHTIPKLLPLKGDVAIDARTNKALRYQTAPSGFKVWGTDWDGQDHGGTRQDALFEYPSSNPIRQPLPFGKTVPPIKDPNPLMPAPNDPQRSRPQRGRRS